MRFIRLVSLSLVLVTLLVLFPSAAAAANTVHVVKRGETLANIAAAYGTTAMALARANGLKNPNLVIVGQRLIIPGAGTTAATASKATASTAAKATTPTQGTRFVASISQQHCWLYVGGKLTGDWVCSTGRRGAPTLPGTFRVQSKIGSAYASTWNFYMPFWLGIYWSGSMENGIHGLPYNPKTGARTWEGLVGTPITFGCIMLDDVHARQLFNIAYIGMPVIVQR